MFIDKIYPTSYSIDTLYAAWQLLSLFIFVLFFILSFKFSLTKSVKRSTHAKRLEKAIKPGLTFFNSFPFAVHQKAIIE